MATFPAGMPTVAETVNHPSFPTALFNLSPSLSGTLPVAEGRGGPLNINWEVHGSGPIKLLLIMGLGSLKTAWQRQTLYFGHEHGDKYSVLLIDNRGMGDSDKPLMRYSTSAMARDALEILEHLGWVSSPRKRQLHLAGISLGGMIAQELACLIPDALSSLTLICTAAAIENTTGFFENMIARANMLIPRSVETTIPRTAAQLFPKSWLVGPDDTLLPDLSKATPGVGPPRPVPGYPQIEEYRRFDNRYQRFVAEEMHKRTDPKRFQRKGFIMQLIAAGWHRKTPEQLKDMGDKVGRERIFVMHGTDDGMITVPHGRKLIAYLQPARGEIITGMGHAPLVERREWFNQVFAEQITLGEKLDGRA
ncbi:alpha/beta-hydrolase [Coniochaeta ligniaria NRRL 30616]|uniref:Alpha/beta-hydrolase n=1 Tax=Coniochaeta ligniaria NRRL 30616 TaxID=1408157 RepID=A0A1J7JFS3_9PEZI|nr:alpha/beta-hydrolase [Coniochaeta ligniaria NRRL 30616]